MKLGFPQRKTKNKKGCGGEGGGESKKKKKNSTSRNLPQQTIVRVGRRVSNQGDRGENRKYLIREIPKNKQAANWQQINFKIKLKKKKKGGEHQSRYLKIRKKGKKKKPCNKSESYEAQRSEKCGNGRAR